MYVHTHTQGFASAAHKGGRLRAAAGREGGRAPARWRGIERAAGAQTQDAGLPTLVAHELLN